VQECGPLSGPHRAEYLSTQYRAWSLTYAARAELRRQGTQVTGLFASLIDTDMTAGVDMPKIRPESVVAQKTE